MAHDNGIFKKYGLDVQLVYIPSSGTNIQALLGGSLDMSAPGISGVVIAAARGAPVLTIGAMTNRPPMTLYVHPETTRAEQLKGQTLGITRFNSTAHTVTALICASSDWHNPPPCARWAGSRRFKLHSNRSRLPGW